MVQGNLLNIIHETEKNLKNILRHGYPVEAVMEAVKNAVLYREYSMTNKVIEIIISNKSITILSPGQMIVKNNKGRKVKYNNRNMWIYEKLISLDGNNTFTNDGLGIKRMKAAFEGNVIERKWKPQNQRLLNTLISQMEEILNRNILNITCLV